MGLQGAEIGLSQLFDISLNLLRQVVTMIGFITTLTFINPILILVICVVSLPQLIFRNKLSKQRINTDILGNTNDRKQNYLWQLLTDLNYFIEIRAYGLVNYFTNSFISSYKEKFDLKNLQNKKEMKVNVILSAWNDLISTLAFLIIIFFALEQRITIGDIILYKTSIQTIQFSFQSILLILSSVNENQLFFNEYKKLTSIKDLNENGNKAKSVPDLNTGIEFRNVSFNYDNKNWILKNFNFFIPSNRKIGLIGLNGCGKTTLIKLLLRYYDPQEGEILWDGINIKNFDIETYRSKFGVLFQDFIKYEFSIKENIGFGDIGNLENWEKINYAADKSGANYFIKNLPAKYNTYINYRFSKKGGDCISLSGGQWRKVALARLFMRDSQNIIMDEPTSNLDTVSENRFIENLENMNFKNCFLIVTHKINILKKLDYIAVIDNNRVVEFGTNDELLEQNGFYSKLNIDHSG
jgi:ABC-type multidrug transport system fused ATPase/permease subunit